MSEYNDHNIDDYEREEYEMDEETSPSSPKPTLTAENLFAGNYRLGEEAYHTSRTVTYRATDVIDRREVWITIFEEYNVATYPKVLVLADLITELDFSCFLPIERVAQTDDGQPYLIYDMSHVRYSLRDILTRRAGETRLLDRQKVVQYLQPIAKALDELHAAGWIHLNLAPDVLLMNDEGRVVLGGWELTRQRDETTHDGIAAYLSPEQAGGRPIGPWCDVYSLGVVIYELMAGQTPFVSEQDAVLVRQHFQGAPPHIRRINKRVPRGVASVIHRALAKQPRERWHSTSALIAAIDGAIPLLRLRLDKLYYMITHPTIREIIGAIFVILILSALGVAYAMRGRIVTTIQEMRPSPTPTATATPTATSLPTVTASPTPVPPTATRTVVATDTPAATNTPTVTFTPTAPPERAASPTPSSTPTEKVYPMPILISPEESYSTSGAVTFEWQWDGTLEENEWFDVRVGKEGEPLQGITWAKETRYTHNQPPGGSGTYQWQIVVIRGSGGEWEKDLSPASQKRRLQWNE